jgi:hypothetical protein
MSASDIIEQLIQVAAYRLWDGTIMCRNKLIKNQAMEVYRGLAAKHGKVYNHGSAEDLRIN